MGGKASAESRRKRKALREYAETLLEMPLSNKKMRSDLSAMGIPDEEMTNALMMVVAIVRRAHKGDIAAFKEIAKIIGEDGRTTPGDGEDDGLFDAIREAVEKAKRPIDEV